MFQELYFVLKAIISPDLRTIVTKNDKKLKFDFLQILWVLHFISHTIDKQQDLGDNWQINVHKNFFCTENNLSIISQTYEKLLGRLKWQKLKFDFANSLSLHL
jgi:hypothetical protein